MKHIQNKNDWFYEFRPQLVLFFGLLGVFGRLFTHGNSTLMGLSQVCGIVLLIIGIKILSWRKTYRAAARRLYRSSTSY